MSKSRRTVLPLNKYLLVIALFAFCLSLIELSEAVELPFETWVLGTSSSSIFSSASLIALMRDLGYVSLFALMTLESASLPIPSEVVLPFAGYLVYLGVMNFELALAVSVAAGLVGALIDYYIALLLGRAVVDRFLLKFGIRSEALQRAEKWFGGRGAWTVLVARFVPLLRSIISFPAGLFRMRLSTFAMMTIIGCFGWSAVLIYAGYAAGQLWNQVIGSSSALLTTAIVLAVALASAFYMVYFAYFMRWKQAG
ncbi:MAG: DedA family protein [Nitrososphaerales archaeon]|nr:DedA family protein [Nitrososphaerales archaeon]